MKNMLMLISVLVILYGCDKNKEERLAAQKTLNIMQQQLDPIVTEIRSVEASQNSVRSAYESLKQDKEKNDSAFKENKNELAEYALSHKTATMAVAASVAGIAGVLSENLQDNERAVSGVASAVGIGYCLFNSEECADAAAKITYLGAQIAYHKDQAEKKSDNLEILKRKFHAFDDIKMPLMMNKDRISSKIEELKQNIENLRCKGIFC